MIFAANRYQKYFLLVNFDWSYFKVILLLIAVLKKLHQLNGPTIGCLYCHAYCKTSSPKLPQTNIYIMAVNVVKVKRSRGCN